MRRGLRALVALAGLTLAAGAAAQPLPPPRPEMLGRLPAEPEPAPPSFPTDTASGDAAPAAPAWPTVGSWRLRPLGASPEIGDAEDRPSAPSAPRPSVAEPGPTLRIPLPPRRPTGLGGIAPLEPDPEGFADASGCLAQLRAAGAVFAPAAQPGANPACAIDNPVRLSAVADPHAPGGTVALTDRPVIACRLALRFGDWVRATAPVLAASRSAPLVSIVTGPGWECRGRNRRRGGKLSAHANGLALDINHWVFANRAKLPVRGHGGDPAFSAVRRASCASFTTVLGPGSDGYHEDHLHLDIMRHGRDGKYRLCR